MNIHPAFVHFPIALLLMYALFEIIRFTKRGKTPYFFHIKAILVIVGTLTAFLTLQTGDMAEESFKRSALRSLIHTHSSFATASTWIFTIIAFVYIIAWFKESPLYQKVLGSAIGKQWAQLERYSLEILQSPLIPLLAVLGLITMTITGALGGAIVYGPDVDPIVNFVYHLFF